LTQLPARDGVPHGNISRSNRYPNCSFFTNWTTLHDSITWHVDVMESALYEVQLYYTCAEDDAGAVIVLQYGQERLAAEVPEAHDPPLVGMQHDRIPRQESYVKDFAPWTAGRLFMQEGTGTLSVKARHIPGNAVMDLRLVMLRKLMIH
jgi:hypothetical protein